MSQAEPMPTLEDAIQVSPDVVFRTLDGEAVLLNLQSGVYFGLNETGTKIWSMLAENTSLAEVHSRMLKEYRVEPDLAKSDLLTLARQLAQKGLVTILPVK
jgi:coenzyme PQQ synthesis protein D (PqqD)